mgnify:CR=1 FL=1
MSICYDHVSLRVTNLERSVGFYGDVMELDLVSRREDDSQAVFRIGEALLVLFCRSEYRRQRERSGSVRHFDCLQRHRCG